LRVTRGGATFRSVAGQHASPQLVRRRRLKNPTAPKEDPLPFRRHLSFANVTAALALFVALGGTGYAAIRIPANSVGNAQIQTNAVSASKIRAGAVGASDIRRGAVGASEIRANAVGSSEIRRDGVGSSEIRRGAIGSSEIHDGAIAAADIGNGVINPTALSAATRALFQAATLRAAVDGSGTPAAGNAKTVTRMSAGQYTVTFPSDVSGCFYSATPVAVKDDTPVAGSTVRVSSAGTSSPSDVLVETFNAGASHADEPFHLIVDC
jgi:hypothetical protein